MCNVLGLEYLKDRWWMQRLCLFHKIFNLNSPKYVYNKIPHTTPSYATRNNKNIPSFICRTKNFMNSSSPNVINEWNKLDIKITNIKSRNTFKSSLLSFIRPLHCYTFGIHDFIGLQLLARLWKGPSHLNEHKLKHIFCDFFNPLCACNLKPETTSHYLLWCHLFQTEWRTLLNDIKEIDENIVIDHKNNLDQILLYGNGRHRYDTNRMILLSTIKFFIDIKRFDLPLF